MAATVRTVLCTASATAANKAQKGDFSPPDECGSATFVKQKKGGTPRASLFVR